MLILRSPWDNQPQGAAETLFRPLFLNYPGNHLPPTFTGAAVSVSRFGQAVTQTSASNSSRTEYPFAFAGMVTGSKPWTFVAQQYFPASGGNYGVIGLRFGSGPTFCVFAGKLQFYTGTAFVDSGITVGTGWHCVALSHDGSGSGTFFVDGVPAGTTSLGSTTGSASTITVMNWDGVSANYSPGLGAAQSFGAVFAERVPDAVLSVVTRANDPWQLFEPQRVYIPVSITSGGAYALNLETGVYSFTGNAATLTKDSRLTLESGTYTLSGSNASLLKGLILEASSGSYSLTGSDASLFYTHLLNASSGSYSVTGSDATLTYTPTAGAYTLNLESGAYVLLGQDVTFVYSGSEVTLKAGSWIRYRIIT